MTFEISVRGRSCFLWSVNFLGFFLAARRKVSGRHHWALWRNKSHDWQSLPLSNMLPYFVSFWLNGWNTDLGLETKRHHIASFDVGGDESLASEVLCRSQIYSARAKLMLISDQARDLFWRPASMCPFQNGSSTSGILNKSTVSAKFTCDDLCGESESYWERVMWWYFACILKVWKHCVWLVVDSFISAANVSPVKLWFSIKLIAT